MKRHVLYSVVLKNNGVKSRLTKRLEKSQGSLPIPITKFDIRLATCGRKEVAVPLNSVHEANIDLVGNL